MQSEVGETLNDLVEAINRLGGFSWSDGVALLSVLASWITIGFLLRDKLETKRPYVQVSFELIRSNLACVVIRNTGTVPVSLCRIGFGKDFIQQLPNSVEKKLLENGITDMKIFPNKYWIIPLRETVPRILDFHNTVLEVEFSYKRLGKKKIYNDTAIIDFKQYAKCLVYISEIDELREVDKKIAESVEEVKKDIKEIKKVITKYYTLEDNEESILVEDRVIIKDNGSEVKEQGEAETP